MTSLEALNHCLAWLTAPTTVPLQVDGLVLCGNSQPATATTAGHLAQRYHLPSIIIAGGVGHATKYLRHNLGVTNTLSEAVMMADLVRQAGYTGELRLDQTSTNSGSNAVNARQLAPANWHDVLLVQDPLLSRRTALTFKQNWSADVTFSWYQPRPLRLQQFDPLTWALPTAMAWPPAYFTELVIGECQRLIDTPAGYGPRGAGFIPHVDVPQSVVQAYQFLQTQTLNRKR
ncbi:YdcF family protein [Lactiplantibacillus garii]|uniref:YdcF family protein n=1 Tax=Lactiplantibacillus garii TaxID=2306423 RepID=A0A426D6N9_9LACO|nr:YdcF family protein [Lactiplantibacillus garii]RRK10240.1 YdcF family protein [Lactiplantibacillus garii]